MFGHFLLPIQEVGMLEVHRESGGFTPRAPLNRVPSGCSTGVEYLPCGMLVRDDHGTR